MYLIEATTARNDDDEDAASSSPPAEMSSDMGEGAAAQRAKRRANLISVCRRDIF